MVAGPLEDRDNLQVTGPVPDHEHLVDGQPARGMGVDILDVVHVQLDGIGLHEPESTLLGLGYRREVTLSGMLGGEGTEVVLDGILVPG